MNGKTRRVGLFGERIKPYFDNNELAMSYFHEYYNKSGDKTLRGFSGPYSLTRYKPEEWVTGRDSWVIAEDLCDIKHFPFISTKQEKLLRPVDEIQMKITKFRVHSR